MQERTVGLLRRHVREGSTFVAIAPRVAKNQPNRGVTGMTRRIHIKATRRVAAPAGRVYDILADYRVGHPRILPRGMDNLVVEQGGRGAGTVIRFEVKSFGGTRTVRSSVDEPEPGRVLRERVLDDGDVETTFTVDPADEGRSQVTIETFWTPRGAFAVLGRLLGPRLLERAYSEELENLETVAIDELDALPAPRRRRASLQ
jgi:hypothetical protein